MESVSESNVVSQGSGTAKTAFHCHQCLTLKLLLIVAVSLFIWALGGASVQVAGYVCVYSVVLAQCWRSGGRVRAVSAMLLLRIQSQVSCDCCADGFRLNLVPAHRNRGQVSAMATDPMQGILFARDG